MSQPIDLLKSNTTILNRKKLYPYILQIGCGGTGGYLVQQIAQMLSIFNTKGHYLIADPDVIETKNLNNQLFIEKDIGKKKADVLARRYRGSYQVDISSYSDDFIETIEKLDSLLNIDYQRIGYSQDVTFLPILISCVDNNYTRKLFNQYFEEFDGNLMYIDVGNHAATVPDDYPQRDKDEWTKEELEIYNESGWSGQVVTGLKLKGKKILEPAATMFPDIIEDEEIAPSKVACSDIVASDPQRLLTNRMAAMGVSVYLNELLESGTVSNHTTFFHAKKGYMRSNPVPEIESDSF